ncbi:hypothetical protein U9M48_000248, partial [Paspalum notatum var. saurae]
MSSNSPSTFRSTSRVSRLTAPQVFKVAGGANITGGVSGLILERARKGYKKNRNTGMQGVMEQSLRKRGYPGKGVGTARDVSSSLRKR